MILMVENYSNAGVKRVQIKDSECFWVKMGDVEKGLCLKNLSDIVRKEIRGSLGANFDRDFKTSKFAMILQKKLLITVGVLKELKMVPIEQTEKSTEKILDCF